jgi:CDP-diacylglycerol--serine O-phosphatidyltransferase
MKYIPNFITSLNLASGFVSIIFIFNGNITAASWLILAAMVFDFLDGFAARALKAYSDIGKELDSLADVVSFGVAPGLIIFHLLCSIYFPGKPGGFSLTGISSIIILIVSAFMPVCAALRLAIFNIDKTQATSFKGLPTPANAMAVITLVLGEHYTHSAFPGNVTSSPLMIIISLSLSILMVTRIPLLSLKFASLKLKGNEGRYLLIAVLIVMVSVFGIGSIPWIIPVYIAVSLLSLLI